MMELFGDIAIAWKPLTIFAKNSILNNWLGTKYYASEMSKVTFHECIRKGTYAKTKSKYCKKDGFFRKNMRKLVWPKSYSEKKLFINFYYTCVAETTLIQVYSLKPGTLLKKNFIKYIFLRPIWNYSQLLFYPWDNCDQPLVKLPLLLHGNTSPICVVWCNNWRWLSLSTHFN